MCPCSGRTIVRQSPSQGEEPGCSLVRRYVNGSVSWPELLLSLAFSLISSHPVFKTCTITEAVEGGVLFLTHFQNGVSHGYREALR